MKISTRNILFGVLPCIALLLAACGGFGSSSLSGGITPAAGGRSISARSARTIHGQSDVAGLPNSAIAPINAAVKAINAGNVSSFSAEYTPDAFVVDDFAPYRWASPNAAANYLKDLIAANQQENIKNLTAKIGAITQSDLTGTIGYVSAPAIVTFQISNATFTIRGNWAFTLRTVGAGWKITSSSFADSSIAIM